MELQSTMGTLEQGVWGSLCVLSTWSFTFGSKNKLPPVFFEVRDGDKYVIFALRI